MSPSLALVTVLCLSVWTLAASQTCSPKASYQSFNDMTYYCDDGSGSMSINNNVCSCGGIPCASCASAQTASCSCAACPTVTTSSGGYGFLNLTGLNPYQTISGRLKVSPGSSSFSIYWVTESNLRIYQSGGIFSYKLSGSNPNQIHCYNNPSVSIVPNENLYIIYQCRNSIRSCNLQISFNVQDTSGNTVTEYGFFPAATPPPYTPPYTPPTPPTSYISAGHYTTQSNAQCPLSTFDSGYTVTSTGTDTFNFKADHGGFYGGTIARLNSTTFYLTSDGGTKCYVSSTSNGQRVDCGSGCSVVWSLGSTPVYTSLAGHYDVTQTTCPSGFLDTGYTVTSNGQNQYSIKGDKSGAVSSVVVQNSDNTATIVLSGSVCLASGTKGAGVSLTCSPPGCTAFLKSSAVTMMVNILVLVMCLLSI